MNYLKQGGGVGLKMPTAPSTVPGQANLKAPAGALSASGAGSMNPMQMIQLAQMLMGPQGQQQQAPAMFDMLGPQGQSSQQTMQFAEQYSPEALMAAQASDDLMRQRMQGLMALLGGQQ